MNSYKIFVQWLRNPDAQQHFNEAQRLMLLNKAYQDRADWRDKAIQERRYWRNAEKLYAEDGQVAVVWSGRDCDCVRYDNVVYTIPCDWRSIMDHVQETYSWADGPCSYYLERPSVADKLRYSSRDLALEAFEDGHPHYIYDVTYEGDRL